MDNFILYGLLFFCGYWLGCKHSEIACRNIVDQANHQFEVATELLNAKDKLINRYIAMLNAKDVTPR